MNTNQVISLRILTLIANGMDAKEAIDQVLGAGTTDKIISDLYDALRK